MREGGHPPNDQIVCYFCEEFDSALAQFRKRLIFNMDEASWRIVNDSLTTIQWKGKDNVSIHLSCDPNHSYCYDLRFRGEAAFVGYSQGQKRKC